MANIQKLRNPSVRKKVYISLKKAEALASSNIEETIRLCLQCIKESRAVKDSELLAISLLLAGKYSTTAGKFNEAISYGKKAISLFEKLDDNDATCAANTELAAAILLSGNTKAALLLLNQILFVRTSSSSETVRSWQDIIFNRNPTDEESTQNYRRALATLYRYIALAYYRMEELGITDDKNKSLFYAQKSLEYWKLIKDKTGIAKTLDTLAGIYLVMDKMDLAIQHYKLALKMYREMSNYHMVGFNLMNTALLHFKSKKLEAGKKCASEALNIFLKMGRYKEVSRALTMVANYERILGSLTQAKKNIDRAAIMRKDELKDRNFFEFSIVKLLIEYDLNPSKHSYLKMLDLYNEAKRVGIDAQYEIALELVKITKYLGMDKETIFFLEKKHEFEIKNERIKHAMEIDKFEVDFQLKQMEDQREVLTLKNKQLESDLKLRARETEILAVQLAKKGSFLKSLTDQFEALKSSRPGYSPETIDAVTQLVDTSRFKDNEFEQLEERAKSLYHDFVVSLSMYKPTLTEAEKKVCILLKLGLNTGDIANALFVSVRTIESHCLSLRRKLKVSRKMQLPKYMQNTKTI